MSPRWIAGVTGAAALAAVLGVVLSGGGGGAGSGGPVALAASVSARAAGYWFTSQISGGIAGTSFSVNGSGAINIGPPTSGSLTETIGSTTVNERIVGSSVYVQSPTSPNSWSRIDISGALASVGDSSSTSLSSSDPSQTVELLRSAGTVTDQGADTVDGIATEHYHAQVDLSRYASTLPASQQAAAEQNAQRLAQLTGSSTLPVDVWIDSAQLVRKLQLSLSIDTKVGTLSESLTTTFSDYGPQAQVSAPPAGEVTDISGQVDSQESQALAKLGIGASSSTPTTPVTTAPATTTPGTTAPATTTPSTTTPSSGAAPSD